MFWMRNKENNFPIRTLIRRPAAINYLLIIGMDCRLKGAGVHEKKFERSVVHKCNKHDY